VLVGRSEGYLIRRTELTATIDRLVAYADAGAGCLYAPGIKDLSAIRAVVSAVAPKPVNFLLIAPNMRVAELADAGVRRVSDGSLLVECSSKGLSVRFFPFRQVRRIRTAERDAHLRFMKAAKGLVPDKPGIAARRSPTLVWQSLVRI